MLKPFEVLKLYPAHDYTLCGTYDSRAAAAGDRPFVIFQGKAWSRTEFRQTVLATARVLAARGIRKGDRVGVIAKNDIGTRRHTRSQSTS